MDPREVTGTASRAVADETGVDLEVAVREERKVLVGLAVEVEDLTVSTHEAGVIAG